MATACLTQFAGYGGFLSATKPLKMLTHSESIRMAIVKCRVKIHFNRHVKKIYQKSPQLLIRQMVL